MSKTSGTGGKPRGVARLLHRSETGTTPVAVGILSAGNQLFTAAHGVNLAIGSPKDAASRPDADVIVDFPFSVVKESFAAKIIAWSAPNDTDVATLQLDSVPPDVEPVVVDFRHHSVSGEVHVYGFPRGFDGGVWASARAVGYLSSGLVQLKSVDQDNRLREGFSGGAAATAPETDASVLGMITKASNKSGIAAMLPTEALVGRLRVPEATRGSAWDSLRYFRETLLTRFLEDMRATSSSDEVLPGGTSVDAALKEMAQALDVLGEGGRWVESPADHMRSLASLFDAWGSASTDSARASHIEAMVIERRVLSHQLRVARALFGLHPDFIREMRRIFRSADVIASENPAAFPRLTKAVNKRRQFFEG